MRVVQGVGGALLVPGSLAILEASFAPEDRGEAIGAWAGLGAVATAAGPLLGGYLISAASWRWIFLINIPVAVVVLFVSVRHVPESTDPAAARDVDVAGAISTVVGLGAVAFALIEGPGLGYNRQTFPSDENIRWAHGYMGMSAAPGAFAGLRAVIDGEHFTDAETVIEGRVCGKHSSEFLGFAPTQRDVELPFVAFYRFDADGKLTSERVIMNLGPLHG